MIKNFEQLLKVNYVVKNFQINTKDDIFIIINGYTYNDIHGKIPENFVEPLRILTENVKKTLQNQFSQFVNFYFKSLKNIEILPIKKYNLSDFLKIFINLNDTNTNIFIDFNTDVFVNTWFDNDFTCEKNINSQLERLMLNFNDTDIIKDCLRFLTQLYGHEELFNDCYNFDKIIKILREQITVSFVNDSASQSYSFITLGENDHGFTLFLNLSDL